MLCYFKNGLIKDTKNMPINKPIPLSSPLFINNHSISSFNKNGFAIFIRSPEKAPTNTNHH